jgi:plastocyanin
VTSDDAVASDVAVPIADIAFPDTITAGSSDTLYVDNRDPVRHDLTVVGTDVAVDLPPGAARRLAVDLPVGTYDVICTVPGHEAMTSTLVVR